MKKKFLFLMTLMAVSLLALAEEHVYVYKKNGAKVHYMAAELDSIGFRGATRGEYRGHEWVDLGLPSGTLWATSYMDGKYTWGDIRVNEENNKWQSSSTYKKYNDDDKKTILELQDDAAHMCWGGDWRMPTKEEMAELFKYCSTSITKIDQHYVEVDFVSNINGEKIRITEESSYNAHSYTLAWSSTKGSSDQAVGIYVIVPQYQYPQLYLQDQYNIRRYLAYIRPVIPGKKTKGVMLHANSSKETKLIEAEHGDVITIPTNPFVRSGYDFIGWNTKADGSGTFYTESTILSVSLPMNLYAQWIKKPTDTETTEGFIDLGLPSGTKWAICNVGADSPEKLGTTSSRPESGVSIEQVRELRSNCTIKSIVINGQTCNLVTSKLNGHSIILPATYYWSGTSCGTWYYWSIDGSEICARTSGDAFKNRKVKRDKFTLTFDANSASGTMEKIEEYQNNVISIPKSTFVRDGYYFSDWNTEADGTGTSYAGKSNVTLKSNMTLYAQWRSAEDTGIENGYEWVDLGLPSGTKWATMNVGATKIEDMGESFAWGETEAKTTYDWTTYKWCNGSMSSLTKYNTSDSYGIFVDNKTILELPDDAAYVHWGGNWRIPTKEAVSELFESDYCTWTQTYQNGQYGVKISSKINGNSIFLPSEYRTYISNYDGKTYYELLTDYHTNSLNKEQPNYQYSYRGKVLSNSGLRSYAMKVRPILPLSFTTITFDANGGDGTMDKFAVEKGIIRNIPRANFFHDGYYFVGWNTKADGTGVSYANSGEIKPESDMTLYAQWKPTEKENGHEWVDLGLPSGTKWATCNIGADKPEEVGELFSWGELEPKSEYSWSTYKWCNGAENKMTKYCNLTKYGTVDMRSRLELVDDAARTNWGSDWRMPSKVEYEELLNEMYCTWTLTTLNGIQGYKVTSKINDAHIFIPLKTCWTRDLYSNNNKAYVLSITEDRNSVDYISDRYYARPIRPILK